MKSTFEKVKSNLAEHLLKIDLEKLSMMELTSYASMVAQLNPLYEEKEDYVSKMVEILSRSSGFCAAPIPSAPLKEV